ncbi:MAG: Ig-like domain-containing protein [Roseburia sp.]|nr:Ig-like domain-containing protein [Roseburia sp.]
MKKKGVLAMLLAFSFAFGAASATGCNILGGSNDDGEKQEQEETLPVAVSGVSLNKNTLALKVGSSEKLTATVSPDNADDKTVSWKSSDEEIATVDNSGNVTARAKGTAVITVTASGGKTDACTVTVSEIASEPQEVKLTNISLNKSETGLKVGDKETLTVNFTPANADNKKVTWSTGNSAVATVENGVVTAKSVGVTTITATSEDGNHVASCKVTVSAAAVQTTPVSGVSLNKNTLTLKVGGSEKLTATVSPANATNRAVSWKSGNTQVATVDDNGNVTAVKDGTAIITVTASDGNHTDTCTVTVEKNQTTLPDPVIDAKISYSYAGNECAAFEWADTNAANAKVEYKLSSASSYTELTGKDKEYLIRQKSASTARVDIVGLKGGEQYDFKITPSSGAALTADGLTVNANDRSGYAHFNYSSGVGAYKDDGTLKSDAKIIYLTDENKNNIDGKGTSIAEYLSSFNGKSTNGTPVVIRVIGTVGSATWNSKTYSGYGKSNPLLAADFVANTPGNGSLTLTTDSKADYTQTQLISGGFNTLNTSRFTAIDGLNSKIMCRQDSKSKEWYYDSLWNDCTVYNMNNVTVEGIGEDAEIIQWGFTFKTCNSIEVRNLHFDDYTEDACSFEGDSVTSAAENLSEITYGNIWLHHNKFDEGKNYWDVCDEQDKGDGDGSTDFKGVKNVTIAYNHYVQTHKTGLIGGGDSHTTANVTFHHNYYESCNQRMPLGRQANMHMYNNYYSGSTLYSISLRAGAYAFIESCYFTEDAANHYPLELVTGSNGTPAAKIVNCHIDESKIKNGSGGDYFYVGDDRYASLKSTNNKFVKNGFDTNSSVFYYDGTKSDVSVMFTAEETKTYVPLLAGVQKRGGDVTLGGAGNGNNYSGSGSESGGGSTGETGTTQTVDFLSQFDTTGKTLEISNSLFAIESPSNFKISVGGDSLLPNSDNTKSFTVTAKTDVTVTIKLSVSSGNKVNTADATLTVSSSAGTSYNNLTFTANSSKLNGKDLKLVLKADEVITITTNTGRINIMAISYIG